MKPYTTIRQFHNRLLLINKQWNSKISLAEPTEKDFILFNKRRKVCDMNLKILYRMIRLGGMKEVSLKELRDICQELIGEILKTSTIYGSWELKAMLSQLNTVTGTIRTIEKMGTKLTFIQKVKRLLKRFKIVNSLTLFTNH